jgi:hypothetical protein
MSYPGTMSKRTNSNGTNSNGSTGNGSRTVYAVIDGKRVPLTYEVARYISQQTHLLGLGNPKRAAEMVAEAERAGINGSSAGTVA